MGKTAKVPYRGREHGGFAGEWGLHRGISEWWYATGSLRDDAGRLYSYQFTILRVKIWVLYPYLVMLAFTDFSTGRHEYFQSLQLSSRGIVVTPDAVGYREIAKVQKGTDGMFLTVRHPKFSLDLMLANGKGPVWQCDKGFLQMGIPGLKQTTVYYSYPNMPTRGTLTLNGVTVPVTGKSWFDKQGGPYSLLNPRTHWEWFSLRFFDDEEIMLFSFPQDGYQDGTFIRRDGSAERLTAYTVTPLEFAYPNGVRYSCKWRLSIPGIKEENYTVTPLLKGQMNVGYYELLAEIRNGQDQPVGLCFVELLPGVYNRKIGQTLLGNGKKQAE